jgi:low affinity Fe/Cu permease
MRPDAGELMLMSLSEVFNKLASKTARMTGRPVTFLSCCLIVVIWAVTGPLFGYSDTWQLVINTGTTIVTFLMVFLIQNTQNRDSTALQAKLDELIRASASSDGFIGIEHLTDDELDAIVKLCEARAKGADGGEHKLSLQRRRTAKRPVASRRGAPGKAVPAKANPAKVASNPEN